MRDLTRADVEAMASDDGAETRFLSLAFTPAALLALLDCTFVLPNGSHVVITAMHEDPAGFVVPTLTVVERPGPSDMDRLLAKARRWKEKGMFTDDEWGAVAAVLFVSDEPSTPAEMERIMDVAISRGLVER